MLAYAVPRGDTLPEYLLSHFHPCTSVVLTLQLNKQI